MIDKPWFKSKNYGLGSYPATIQGWTIILVWTFLAIYIFRIIDKNSHSASDSLISFFVPFVLLLILLVLIFIGTGKKYKSSGYITLN